MQLGSHLTKKRDRERVGAGGPSSVTNHLPSWSLARGDDDGVIKKVASFRRERRPSFLPFRAGDRPGARGFHHRLDQDRDPRRDPPRRNGCRPSILIKALQLLTTCTAAHGSLFEVGSRPPEVAKQSSSFSWGYFDVGTN